MFRQLATIAILLTFTTIGFSQEHWPQFRGPGGSGVSAKPLPTKWDEKTNIAWSVELPGRGWSSPIVWGDKIFVTAVLNDKTPASRPGLYIQDLIGKIPPGEHVWKLLCLDFNNGKILWDRTVHQGKPTGPIHIKNSYASETPATDGEHVFVYFGNLGISCYDMQGKQVWSRKLETVRTKLGWGTAASPVVHGGHVYIVNDNEDQSYLLALNKKTGEDAWKTPRDEKSNWGTPFVWQHKERTEIVTAGVNRVRSYDLMGKQLWELKGMSVISIPTPFAGPEHLYITSGYVLDFTKPVYAIKPGAKGDISLEGKATSNDFIAWTQKAAGPYHPTPVYHDGFVYVLLDKGFLSCYDAKTGREVYGKQRIHPNADKFTASPWAADGKIYCLSEDGETYVIRGGEKFEVLAQNPLNEMTLATPALVRGNMVIRTAKRLIRVGN